MRVVGPRPLLGMEEPAPRVCPEGSRTATSGFIGDGQPLGHTGQAPPALTHPCWRWWLSLSPGFRNKVTVPTRLPGWTHLEETEGDFLGCRWKTVLTGESGLSGFREEGRAQRVWAGRLAGD